MGSNYNFPPFGRAGLGPIYEFLLSGGLEQGPLKAGRVRKLVLPPLGRVGVGVWGVGEALTLFPSAAAPPLRHTLSRAFRSWRMGGY